MLRAEAEEELAEISNQSRDSSASTLLETDGENAVKSDSRTKLSDQELKSQKESKFNFFFLIWAVLYPHMQSIEMTDIMKFQLSGVLWYSLPLPYQRINGSSKILKLLFLILGYM